MNDAIFEVRSEAPPVTLVGVQGGAGRMDAEFFRPVFVRNEARLRSGRFSVANLGDLILKGNYGSLPDSGDYSSSGVPLIRGTDLRSMVVTLEAAVRVPEAYLDKFKKAQVQPGDLLMLAKGASLDRPDSVAMYPLDGPTALANGSIFVMRPDRKKVNPFFLLGYLASNALLLQKRRASTNTGALYNDIGSISGFLIPLPDCRIQDYIGAKVELAERCRTASTTRWAAATNLLGTALGVPLTPETFEVKSASNVSGAGYEVTSVRPVVAMVAPSRLVGAIGAQFFTPRRAKAILVIEQSGLGAKRLSALADRFTKRVSADEVQARGMSYVGLAQVDSSTGFVSTASDDEQPSSSSGSFEARDILFSKLRPYLNKVAICPEHLEEAAGSTELVTYRAKPGVDPYYVFFVLKSPLVLNQVIDITSGSTHPRVDPDLIDDVLVPMAEAAVQKRIGRLARAALELMRRATLLIEEAKADVEAMIEGTLDVEAILAGTLKAPTADDIPELAEDDA